MFLSRRADKLRLLVAAAVCGHVGATTLVANEQTNESNLRSPQDQASVALLPQIFENPAWSNPSAGWQDLLAEQESDTNDDDAVYTAPERYLKSPQKSLLYSALLPGAGELYAGAKKRAALFFGLEAVAWGLYFSWNGKGNDIEDDFRAVANEQWDPLSYISWRGSTISRNSSITHALPCSSYVVTANSVADCPSGEKQQYYELIGKYDQYISGWDDVQDRNSSPVQPTEIDSAENFLSQHRLTYEDLRDDSNKFLKRATNVAGLILVNHVFSAIDASRVARATAHGVNEATLQRRTRFAFTRSGGPGKAPMIVVYKPIH